jgi:acyl transferase domain-containing protein/threonine dehydrogenase-like Zn-dependent dehydrogenase/short-subunit dehydrogenase/acyl carrier protein
LEARPRAGETGVSANTPEKRNVLGQALQAIESLQNRLDAIERARTEPIAIVGLACRFPGAPSANAYWTLLRDGRDAVTEVPGDRWDKSAFLDADPDAPGKMHSAFGGFLEGIDQFDAAFFGIAGREADTMDPQQRLLLEVAWHALEDAGIAPTDLRGSKTAVYVGITTTDYARLALASGGLDVYTATGGALNVAAGRISYVLGLNGPAAAIDTACSSSLVSVHLACQSLRSGECDAALAGGVNVLLSPEPFVCFAKWGMMAPDGRCKTFDERADGFVRSEGCGVIVLKRLRDAIAAGDRVLATIRGTAVNQDGASSGLTVPNGLAQEAVVRAALQAGGVEPHDVSYVEAHGTGTTLGDPIELEALAAVLARNRPADRPLYVGSVKTNIGHAESASGIAGLIKVVLAMQHEEIPRHLHFARLNPRIALRDAPIRVPTEPTPWPASSRRFAGVSSFGFSGTNAHAVLEAPDAVTHAERSSDGVPRLLVLSAKTKSALRELAGAYATMLRAADGDTFADICSNAAVGRAAFAHRLALVAADAADAATQLEDLANAEQPGTTSHGHADAGPKVAFLFSGQGAQYFGMARELYDSEPVFRESFERCAALVDGELGSSLRRIVGYEPNAARERDLDDTRYTQPALFAVEFACAELWQSWGIRPTAVAGHSLGEYVAACVAGVLSLEEALSLVVLRSRLMSELPRDGSMLAVLADEARVRALLAPHGDSVAVAAVNGPNNVVVSGLAARIADVARAAHAAGIESRPLSVSHAFHSPLVEPMLREFEQHARAIRPRTVATALVSNLSGALVRDTAALDASYWRRHAREPVRFADACRALYMHGARVFVEIGPAPVLVGMARSTVTEPDAKWLASMRRGEDPRVRMLASLGALFVAGAKPQFARLGSLRRGRHVELPSYPFQRKRFWLPVAAPSAAPSAVSASHPLLGRCVRSPLRDVLFESAFASAACPVLGEHKVAGVPIVPAAAYIEAACAAARELGRPASIADGWLRAPLSLDDRAGREATIVLSSAEDGSTFEVFSRPIGDRDAEWTRHAGGRLVRPADVGAGPGADAAAARAACTQVVDIDAYRRRMTEAGLDYGPSFRALETAWRGTREAFGELRLPADDTLPSRVFVHPGLLDAAFHLIGVALNAATDGKFFLPVGFEAAAFPVAVGAGALAHVRLRIAEAARIVADIVVWRSDGSPAGYVRGLEARPIASEQFRAAFAARTDLQRIVWREAPAAAALQAPGAWLVVGDEPLAAAIALSLRARGFSADRIDDEEIANSLGAAHTMGVIDLRPLALPSGLAGVPPTLVMRDGPLEQAAALLRRLALRPPGRKVRVTFVTRGAQPVVPEAEVGPLGAALWGFAACAAAELSACDVRMLDLDSTSDVAGAAESIVTAALRADTETRGAVRDGVMRVPRLVPLAERAESDRLVLPTGPYGLAMRERGTLTGLAIEPATRAAPAAARVEVEVLASGMNFRDVLNLLDMYPGPAGPLGNECCGRIVAVGAGVDEFRVGDLVMCIAEATFGSHVVAEAALTFHVPPELSIAQAAAFPIAQLTAYLSLHEVGGIGRGSRVLIHAAAGGVGLAAVHLALAAGAEVVATAGSESKRAYLRQLGVHHVFDSRRTLKADEVRNVTDGRGVDVVLNSLTGAFIEEGLAALAPGGKFVEIGLREIRAAADLRPDITYYALLLGDLCRRAPATVRSMYAALRDLLASRAIPAPLTRTYPLAEAPTAFRYMAKARHVGRIALLHPAIGRHAIRGDAAYLVTGGLGALGRHTARWLVERGARHVVLMGRREPDSEAARELDALRERGVRVDVLRRDVAAESSLEGVRDLGAPLRGVFHAAGVTDDRLVASVDAEHLRRVMRPKADGAHALHAAGVGELDLLVLFSSGSAVLGPPGQSAYGAANAFLDGWAHGLRANGVAATSIDWGAWAEGGMASRLSERTQRDWASRGIGTLSTEQAFGALEQAVASGHAQTAVLAINWQKFSAAADVLPPLLAEAAPRSVRPPTAATPVVPLADDLKRLPPKDRSALLLRRMLVEVSAVLGIGPDEIDVRAGLTEQGMDSLMAVELASRLGRLAGISLPSTFAFDHPTLAALAAHLLAEIGVDAAAARPSSAPRAASAGDLADLSESDLELELRRELDEAGL